MQHPFEPVDIYDQAPASAGTHAESGPTSGERVLETVQTVLTALILAFIFRAFFVEQFVIPTGSMAPSLLGTHATFVCPACAYEFDVAPDRSAGFSGERFVAPPRIVCPNCQLVIHAEVEQLHPKAGDRILVNKWPYAIGGRLAPRRWDVVVFRDPGNPDQHYIKRVVGLPGETVEIIDGDVFINARIARKPPAIQSGMWMIVFDQRHAPHPETRSGRLPRWRRHDPPPSAGGGWQDLVARVLRYDANDATPRSIAFNPDTGHAYLMDFSAYNHRASGVFVGDVRLCGSVQFERRSGWCAFRIERPPYRFVARVSADGRATLHMSSAKERGAERLIGAARVSNAWGGHAPLAVELAHVDYRVYLALDGEERVSTTPTDYAPDLDTLRIDPPIRPVGVSLTACETRLTLRDLRIERDVHYTRSTHTLRAFAGQPFKLGPDEYFVLGDNSADSHDSREWSRVGPHLPAGTRPGIVRGDQIVGQAAFVYLPGLLPSEFFGGRRVIPDLGRVRFVR